MNINFKNTLRGLAAVSALAAIALPVAAQAQTEDQIQGTIAAVTGQYSLQVNDSRGYVDNVGLQDGTIINPTGLTLAAGQTVTIYGEPDGDTFVANEIDTPYNNYAPAPVYYGAPAYPYYSGPAVGIGLRIGGGFNDRGFDHRVVEHRAVQQPVFEGRNNAPRVAAERHFNNVAAPRISAGFNRPNNAGAIARAPFRGVATHAAPAGGRGRH